MDYLIITAGGKGLRMGADIPKQFIPINGKPILMRTIEQFRKYSKELHIILVLPKDNLNYWQQLCRDYSFHEEYDIIDGGDNRFHSIQHGLNIIPDDIDGIVGIHDGVRPFPSLDVIARCFDTARTAKAVIPVIPIVETVRYIKENKNVPRSDYKLVQTPQCFDIRLIKKAYKQPFCDNFTDDASVVEAIGQRITMVGGNRENIKITTPFDLKVAEVLCK
nr:2-C-methyl-D-erythritol 4-phosphate cytidylyltransferase [Prevotella sp.]